MTEQSFPPEAREFLLHLMRYMDIDTLNNQINASRINIATDGNLLLAGSSVTATATDLNSIGGPPLLGVLNKSADYSVVQGDGPVIIVDASGSVPGTGVTITLFASTLQPNDGNIHRYWVHKLAGASNQPVHIVCADGTFADGLTDLVIVEAGSTVQLGGMYDATNPMWLRISAEHVHAQVRRNATWAAANFAALAAVPLDTIDLETNPAVLDVDLVGQPTRVTAKYAKRYTLQYAVFFDSSGGGAWQVESSLRVNGSTTIPGSVMRSGNSGNEDQSVSSICLDYEFAINDYVELMLDHTNLTGNLNGAVLSVQADV